MWSQCLTCARAATVSLWETTFDGSLGERPQRWWCANLWKKYDWRQLNRLLVVQTGESFEQAKVVKAYAVPLGLCVNLINALKLLANQQEDGDGPPAEHRDEPRHGKQKSSHGRPE